MSSLYYLLPEIFMFLMSVILLMTGLFIKKIKVINYLAIFSIAVTIIIILNQSFQSILQNSFIIDEFSKIFKVMILIGSASSLIMFFSSREDQHINFYEFPILILFSTIGMMVMVSSNDLLLMFIGLEVQSLGLYVLAALNRNSLLSSEAGIKYFILGALSSGLLLFGISYIYGFTGNTNFNLIAVNYSEDSLGLIIGIVFVCSGLAFKVSAVPFHMWTPDVYQGAPTPITGFFALAPKIAAMGLLVRFLFNSFGEIYIDWQQILIFISIASMLFAAIAAIAQTNIKRLMAYSSIGHIGYALIGVACVSSEGLKSLTVYLIIYLIMNISVFAFILTMKRNDEYFEQISDMSGLYRNHPFSAIMISLMMFSLAGIPPLAGFFGKFYIFMAAVESNMFILAIIGIIASVIGAFYYLRIVKVIYFDEPQQRYDGASIKSLAVLFYPTSLLVIIFCFYPLPLLNIAETASKSFF
tara:strand:+ start:2514 stop:3923 length:1410 start_codon:yes stop_codon:yes gene_type:complete